MNFSIVTVVYNDIQHIESTMASVVEQSYKQIEYILIDGGSTDGTKEAIIKYISLCANTTLEVSEVHYHYLEAVHKDYSSLTFKLLSEKDKGIYDAMNKGVSLATKEWINFMNCRDRFYNSNVLEEMTKYNLEQYDIVYGDTLLISTNKISKVQRSKRRAHKYHHHFTHQSSFIKTKLAKDMPYDTSFKIAGDTDFFAKAYNSDCRFFQVNLIVSIFCLDGISSKLSFQMFYEDCRIGFKYNKFFPLYLTCKWVLWTIPRKIFINIFNKKNV